MSTDTSPVTNPHVAHRQTASQVPGTIMDCTF